ncbi:MAG: AAA family ATPase [Planctomycetes bacterium]|nr:AAA family ATPase [Planctomycetota bacterium]
MTDFDTVCDHVDDLPAFAALDHRVVQNGLIEGMELAASDGRDVLEKPLAAVQARLQRLAPAVRAEFVGRDDAVDALCAGLASGVPAVLLGPPGTAKSAIAREVARRCGLGPHMHGQGGEAQGYFEYLLTSHTMPEELFGAPDLKALTTSSIFQRNTAGMLPTAQLALLDEVFRGGSHILNTLLTLLNERLFHDGRTVIPVPLVGVIAASNEPPVDPDLTAFFDRFPIRIWVESIFDEQARGDDAGRVLALLKASAAHELRNLKTALSGRGGGRREQVSCVNDLRCARSILTLQLYDELVNAHSGRGGARLQQFVDLFRQLFRRAGLSDRTLFALLRFAQALGWLASPKDAATAHFRAFRFVARSAQERAQFAADVHDAMQGIGYAGVQ